VWEEDIPIVNLSSVPKPADAAATGTVAPAANGGASEGDKPPPLPVTPRKRGLWGMASALSERASNWTLDPEKNKSKEALAVATNATSTTSHGQNDKINPQQQSTAPSEKTESRGLPTPISRPSTPPPLPKRNDVRRPVEDQYHNDQPPIIGEWVSLDEHDFSPWGKKPSYMHMHVIFCRSTLSDAKDFSEYRSRQVQGRRR
jgi:hypothetical protein